MMCARVQNIVIGIAGYRDVQVSSGRRVLGTSDPASPFGSALLQLGLGLDLVMSRIR